MGLIGLLLAGVPANLGPAGCLQWWRCGELSMVGDLWTSQGLGRGGSRCGQLTFPVSTEKEALRVPEAMLPAFWRYLSIFMPEKL